MQAQTLGTSTYTPVGKVGRSVQAPLQGSGEASDTVPWGLGCGIQKESGGQFPVSSREE